MPFRVGPGGIGAPTVYFAGNVSRELGRLARVAGRPEQAEELLREGLHRNRALGARAYTVLTALDLAELLLERATGTADVTPAASGQQREAAELAAELAAEALATAGRLDMPGHADRSARLLARTTASAHRHDADPLTPREREVATLVAEARTNRQIAERLVLSERTVESHVRSILAKLGCANRTELVARLR